MATNTCEQLLAGHVDTAAGRAAAARDEVKVTEYKTNVDAGLYGFGTQEVFVHNTLLFLSVVATGGC